MTDFLSAVRFLALAACFCRLICGESALHADEPASSFRLSWESNYLSISHDELPGGDIRIHYLEAYCRPGSTSAVWQDTVIGHSTELVNRSPDSRRLELACVLRDGVRVSHLIEAVEDGVRFTLVASNPTGTESVAHWAQPCVRLDRFTGGDRESYHRKGFIFLDGKLARMPTARWSTDALYVPGQVWCPRHVSRDDVNPRPLSPLVPSCGLIGCFSHDDSWLFATAWEPYQELFQGVASCLHSDFRIGGLRPGESKTIRGRIYLMSADTDALVQAYRRDFPGQDDFEKKRR